MKNKKFLTLVLALVMVLGAFAPVFAAEAPKTDAKADTTKVEKVEGVNNKVQWLVDHKFVEGRKVNEDPKNNDLALDKNIKRAEITKLLVYAIGRQDLAAKVQGTKIYTDVEANYWANGVITVGTTLASPANNVAFLNGYPDRSFRPENNVTYGELSKMLVTLVKTDLTQAAHDNANKNHWPAQWITWATQLGILDDVKVADANKAAVRSDAFVMLYNALYQLKEYRKVPANETLGVISAVNGYKVTLNQGDFKKEFTVDAKTNFVRGYAAKNGLVEVVQWDKVLTLNAREHYYIGSLVRVLTDDKGNVTHIVQLGNPADLAIVNNNWKDVAQNVVESSERSIAGLYTRTTATGTVNYLNIYGKDLLLTNSTRYFLAGDGVYTEVKDLGAAKDYLVNAKRLVATYAGYDELKTSGVNQANVVVFNGPDVDGNAKYDVVRVAENTNTKYVLDAHKANLVAAKAELVHYDQAQNKEFFPFGYNLDPYDVLRAPQKGNAQAKVLIDHSEAPTYKVVKIDTPTVDGLKYVDRKEVLTLTLTDGRGQAKVDVLRDAFYFFGDQVQPGAFVQVHVSDLNNKLLDVVSVVPAKETSGNLDALWNPKDTRQVEAVVGSVENSAGEYTVINVNVVKDGKQNPYPESFVVATQYAEGANKLLPDDRITFLTNDVKFAHYNLPLGTNVRNLSAEERAKVAAADADIKAVQDAQADKAPAITLDQVDKKTVADLEAKVVALYTEAAKKGVTVTAAVDDKTDKTEKLTTADPVNVTVTLSKAPGADVTEKVAVNLTVTPD